MGYYNVLRGYGRNFNIDNPTPYVFGAGPFAGTATKWPLSGDPISDPMALAGDVDGNGNNFGPGDRRYMLSSGPFTLAESDTQEIVLAILGGNDQLNGRLAALGRLKTLAGNLQESYQNQNNFPKVSLELTSRSHETALHATVDLSESSAASSANITLTSQKENGERINIPLFDDGMHDDSLAGDQLWGSETIFLDNRPYPHDVALQLETAEGRKDFPQAFDAISLRPEPQLFNFRQTWENGRQDGMPNPGEQIHIMFDVLNRDAINAIETLQINDRVIENVSVAPLRVEQSAEFRFVIDVPPSGDSLSHYYRLGFDHVFINGAFALPVSDWQPGVNFGRIHSLLRSFKVLITMSFPIVADAFEITGDRYQVEFYQEMPDSQLLWRLRNLETSAIMIEGQPLVDSLEYPYPYPVVDGIQFQVRVRRDGLRAIQTVANASGPLDPPEQGTFAFNANGFPTHDGEDLMPGINDRPDASRQQTNGSTWGIHTGGTTRSLYTTFLERVFRNDNIERAVPFDYELRFTEEGGYANWFLETQEMGEVPFEIWNIGINTPDDPTDDYRMIPWVLNDIDFATGPAVFNINQLDHAVSGTNNDPYTDWIYWRDPEEKTPGDAGYQQFVEDGLAGTYVPRDSAEVMARMVLVNWNGGFVDDPSFPANVDALMPEIGTIFRLLTTKPSMPGDRLLVDTSPVYQPELFYPETFSLRQNYPNPFNPQTTIEFALPEPVDVKLEVYNVLGQRVITLMDRGLEPAEYQVVWDGRNSEGNQVASGIYFYRLKAGRFVKTRKMILIH